MSLPVPRDLICYDKDIWRFVLESADIVGGTRQLRLLPSRIDKIGVGVFTTKEIARGSKIYWSVPIVSAIDEDYEEVVCDLCYASKLSSVNREEERFMTPQEDRLSLIQCNGCKAVWYCSIASRLRLLVFYR
jgi:hypothetical protein